MPPGGWGVTADERILFTLTLRRGEVLRYLAIDRFLRARFTWVLVIVSASMFLVTASRDGQETLWSEILVGIVAYPAILLLLWMVNTLAVVFQVMRMFRNSSQLNEGDVEIDAARFRVSGQVNSWEFKWAGVTIFRISSKFLILQQTGGVEILIPRRLVTYDQMAMMRNWWQAARP